MADENDKSSPPSPTEHAKRYMAIDPVRRPLLTGIFATEDLKLLYQTMPPIETPLTDMLFPDRERQTVFYPQRDPQRIKRMFDRPRPGITPKMKRLLRSADPRKVKRGRRIYFEQNGKDASRIALALEIMHGRLIPAARAFAADMIRAAEGFADLSRAMRDMKFRFVPGIGHVGPLRNDPGAADALSMIEGRGPDEDR